MSRNSYKKSRVVLKSHRSPPCCHGLLYTACGKCRKQRAKTAKSLALIPDECPSCGAPDYNPEAECENCIDIQESLANLKGEDHET
jgi:hypothetical protein